MNEPTDYPVGESIPDWSPREPISKSESTGRFCRLEPLSALNHGRYLWDAFSLDPEGRNFTYLPYGPFADYDAYLAWLVSVESSEDPLFHAILDLKSQRAVGVASFLRIDPTNGVLEIGHLNFSPLLQRQPAATEAIFLMLSRTFDDFKYRRCEWKCDSLNTPSRAAAERFGFQFEGLFRQAVVVKGRNRDTAWYAMVDKDWPSIRRAFEAWLDPQNFNAQGAQVSSLAQLRQARFQNS